MDSTNEQSLNTEGTKEETVNAEAGTNMEAQDAGIDASQQISYEEIGTVKEPSNIVTGIIGAILGALIGVVVWVAIGWFGFIASIAGVAIITFAFKGYKMLGGSIDMKAIVVVCIISVLMVYIANKISWSIDIYKELTKMDGIYDITLLDVYKSLHDIIKEAGIVSEYIKDLGVGYALTILGGFTIFKNQIKAVKESKNY